MKEGRNEEGKRDRGEGGWRKERRKKGGKEGKKEGWRNKRMEGATVVSQHMSRALLGSNLSSPNICPGRSWDRTRDLWVMGQ